MTTSTTSGHTATEIRPTRRVGSGDEQRTIRVRAGRGNSRRRAVADQLAGLNIRVTRFR